MSPIGIFKDEGCMLTLMMAASGGQERKKLEKRRRKKTQEKMSDDVCSICLCKIEDEQRTQTLDCGHVFHVACICQHYAASGHCNCPNCRAPAFALEEAHLSNNDTDTESSESSETDSLMSVDSDIHETLVAHLKMKLQRKFALTRPSFVDMDMETILSHKRKRLILNGLFAEFGIAVTERGSIPETHFEALAEQMLNVTESDDEDPDFNFS